MEPSAGPLAITGWVLFDWASKPFYVLIYDVSVWSVLYQHDHRRSHSWAIRVGLHQRRRGSAHRASRPGAGSGRRRRGAAKTLARRYFGSVRRCPVDAVDRRSRSAAALVPVIIVVFIVATLAAELAVVLNNTMMLSLVPPDRAGPAFGHRPGRGIYGGLLSLIIITGVSFNFAHTQSAGRRGAVCCRFQRPQTMSSSVSSARSAPSGTSSS